MTVPPSPFPLSTWSNPAVTGVGRLPMAPFRAPFESVDAARRGDRSPWVRSLDGPWQIRIRPDLDAVTSADVGELEGRTATPPQGWNRVTVPGSWVLPFVPDRKDHGAPIYLNVRMPFDGQAPAVPRDNPTALYRRVFTVPPAWRARRTLLRVGSANSMGFVWINGAFVGLGTDSHLASTYDITERLRRGRNTVCIAVPRWSASTWVEDQDQWWMPGLHRSVELVSVPPVAIGDTAMVPGLDRDGTTGLLDLDISVEFAGADPFDGSIPLTAEVLVEPIATAAPGRRPLATTGPVDVPRWRAANDGDAHGLAYTWPGHRVIATLRVPGIEPWNHELPKRYRAIVALRNADGDVLDVRTRPIGFRRVELADRALLVNGVPVLINGVNHHDVHPDRGPATTPEDSRADLELMKRHHINAVRTSHYPHDETFYELCDELGVYVVDEADIETHARWRAISDDPTYAASFLERGMRTVLRDRSHPSVIAWSLGNESGYGPSHDAMAAWIRRVDPSRPVHYEGGFSLDLDAASPASDIVCPMYASTDRIVQWSRQGTDRRPLILCEYSHAMGQAGGLADYWAVFGVEEGLQGGFVWEWADHALRRIEPDGTEWFAYGGDFGEVTHDGSFLCDGLVSPDRRPHPLLAELAALTQPVTVSLAGPGRLRITNRRWFTDVSDLVARWELAIDGQRVRGGRLALPPVGPQSSADVDDPAGAVNGPGRAVLTVTFVHRQRNRPSWADDGWIAALSTIDRPGEADAVEVPGAHRHRRRHAVSVSAAPTDVHDDGIAAAGIDIGWPELSVWRAPTDNDEPPADWRPARAVDRWREIGLDRLSPTSSEVGRKGRTASRLVRYTTRSGSPIEHRQRLRADASTGGVVIDERIVIDRTITDLPRVGLMFELPSEFEQLRWLGLGPDDTYPDRKAAGRFGLWASTVSSQILPFIVPQEHGLHLDTDWFELASPLSVVRIAGDRPLAFSALAQSAGELTSTTHAHQLPPRRATHVHIDILHRGLGTAACGPDTHPRHLIRGGVYTLAWRLSARSPAPE